MSAFAINFHHFYGENHLKGQGAINAKELSSIIDYIGPERIKSPEEWSERSLKNQLDDKDVCLTFDDGLRCQYDVAFPILKERGIKAFWFVYSSVYDGIIERLETYRYYRTKEFREVSDFYKIFDEILQQKGYGDRVYEELKRIDLNGYLPEYAAYTLEDRWFRYIRDKILGSEKYFFIMDELLEKSAIDFGLLSDKIWLKDDQLKELQKYGHQIGLHSYSHPTAIAELDEETQRSEYQKNFQHLNDCLGVAPRAVSHPCNSYNEVTLKILQDMGITLGFRANTSTKKEYSLLEQPREDHMNIFLNM